MMQSIGSAPVGGPTATPPAPAIEKVSKQFEAVFLRQMIAAMRGPSLGDDLLGSEAGKQFRDMSDARLADAMAGRFGIAAMLEKQIGTSK